MFCPHCGTQNPDAAKFCGSCGKAMPSLHPTAAPTPAATPAPAPAAPLAPPPPAYAPPPPQQPVYAQPTYPAPAPAYPPQPAYPQQPAYAMPAHAQPQISRHMGLAIFSLIYGLLMLLPLAFSAVAVSCSRQVTKELAAGRFDQAQRYAGKAKRWAITSIVISTLVYLYVFIQIMAAIEQNSR